MEQTVQTAVTVTSSASSTMSPKVSMFAKKSGFVIPKNKLSGSLVPIFRGSKKTGVTDAESEENTKQVLRKTKWGPDLTQDASVKKGRAFAYQTRVDQITQQLKLGVLEAADDHYSSIAQDAGPKSPHHQISETSELLEIERREAIGEILKLNPSYKAPDDYKPLLKETKIPIPIKEYPGHNFIGLIFGPAGDTQKRLEKETGAKIRVYVTKADIKEEREITTSDGNGGHGSYDELLVLVSAESYEKVDAAVSLIELLVTPVSAKAQAVSGATVAVSGDDPNPVGLSQGTNPSYAISPVLGNQGAAQTFTGSGQTPTLAQFQPYPNQWLPAGQSSGFIPAPFPNSSAAMLTNPIQVSASPSNPVMMPSLFGPGPVMSGGLASVPQSPLAPSRPQPMLQRPNMLQAPNLGFNGSPRNPSLPPLQSIPNQPNFSAQPPFTPHPPTPTGPNQNMQPPLLPHSASSFTFPERPLTSAGWPQPLAASPGARGPTHMSQMMQPVVRPQSPLPMASQPIAISGGQSLPFRPAPSVAPLQSVGPQLGTPSSVTIPPPSVIPPSITTLRPQQPRSNDFTFQPHRAQTPPAQPRPGSQPGPHPMHPQNPMAQPPPQSPSFRPGIINHGGQPVMQGFPRPQNQMGQHHGQPTIPPRQPLFPGPGPGPHPSATHVPQMGPRHFGPAPPASPFPPRPGNFGQVPHNHPGGGFRPQHFLAPPNQQSSGNIRFPSGMPASSSSRPQQVYDPFSPTAIPPRSQIGGNHQNSRKSDSDPEYDDLMASVGVK